MRFRREVIKVFCKFENVVELKFREVLDGKCQTFTTGGRLRFTFWQRSSNNATYIITSGSLKISANNVSDFTPP